MASFLVETHVIQGGRAQFATAVDQLRAALDAVPSADRDVRLVRSYLVPRDELGVHVLQANSADAVLRLTRAAGIEVERIVSAVGLDPAEEGDPGIGAPR
jgi:hypothetical protein